MACVHLRQLFELCEQNELRFSSSDLVHIVCRQCERDEVCPSLLVDEYDAQQQDSPATHAPSQGARSDESSNTSEQNAGG